MFFDRLFLFTMIRLPSVVGQRHVLKTVIILFNPGTFHGTQLDKTEPAKYHNVHSSNMRNDHENENIEQIETTSDMHCTLEFVVVAISVDYGIYTQPDYWFVTEEYARLKARNLNGSLQHNTVQLVHVS